MSDVVNAVDRWVNRQVREHVGREVSRENTDHKAFFAYTYKEATQNLREGIFRVWKPNPAAAEAIEDYVSAKLTKSLIRKETTP